MNIMQLTDVEVPINKKNNKKNDAFPLNFLLIKLKIHSQQPQCSLSKDLHTHKYEDTNLCNLWCGFGFVDIAKDVGPVLEVNANLLTKRRGDQFGKEEVHPFHVWLKPAVVHHYNSIFFFTSRYSANVVTCSMVGFIPFFFFYGWCFFFFYKIEFHRSFLVLQHIKDSTFIY